MISRNKILIGRKIEKIFYKMVGILEKTSINDIYHFIHTV